jgi:YVTN family beta-propeller protein
MVAITPNGTRAYVSNQYSNGLSIINTQLNKVIETIPVERQPFGLAVTPDGRYIYVVNSGVNNTSVIDAQTNQTIDRIPVGLAPFGIAITNIPNNRGSRLKRSVAKRRKCRSNR